MASDGRSRSGGSRSGGRKPSQRSEWHSGAKRSPVKSASGSHLSSSEEEDQERDFLPHQKKGERGVSSRSRVTPSDLVVVSQDLESSHKLRDVSPLGGDAAMTQLPPHYYQDAPQGHYRDEYDSPGVKSSVRRPKGLGVRRIGTTQGSSLSSSDNNSDTTYAESDINSSVRARMAALDQELTGNPPEPAPPEIPPRGPSHHHPLLTSQRRGGAKSGSPLYPDQPPEEGYQPTPQNVFLSQEYLISGTTPRYMGTGGGKSPGGPTVYGPSPNLEYLPTDISQQSRILGTLSSQKGVGGLSSHVGGPGVGLTSLPTIRNALTVTSRASLSGRSLHLGKTWRERCTWKCGAFILIGVCALLAALLTYFIVAYATYDSGTKGCVMVEDAAKVIAADAEERDTTTSYPTPAFTIPVTSEPVKKSGVSPELTRLQVLNKRYTSSVAPQGFWHVQFVVKQPMFMRFNLTVPRSSQLAFYGRRNVAPSITQYDFVEFIRSGRTAPRMKRGVKEAVPSFVENFYSYYYEEGEPTWTPDGDEDEYSYDENNFFIEDEEEYQRSDINNVGKMNLTATTAGLPSDHRRKRYISEHRVNMSLVEHLDTGIWYLSLYNDGLAVNQVSLHLEEAPDLQSACPNDCSDHGSCVLGRCECVQGWVGDDCSKSVCPVLCSGHGTYGGGVCHCHKGWKGQECDVPQSDCVVSDCHGHGSCIMGNCACKPGWKGELCDLVDCLDPKCGDHGWCIEGSCVCRAGWQNKNCSQVDHKVFTCLPDCSGNGHYDLQSSSCVCDEFWTGPTCSEARCTLDCVHGTCDGGACACQEGWTGSRCADRACDRRCSLHGQCLNGTCLCIQGWNGLHCTIPGCVNSCSGNGLCTTEDGAYRCSCSPGWMGPDCSVAMETQCSDEEDNDGDSLTDCNDSECCVTPECRDHVMCMVSSDPVEVLLRKQPPAVTASFYQRVKFIIEDRNVQSFARKDEFTERRVSVIRGRVVTPQGQGIVGVRTSVEKESKYGLTATRKDGWFDVLVNGGGAVTLQFQRAHFDPITITVPVLWNQIVVLDPVVMRLKDQPKTSVEPEVVLPWTEPCLDHNHERIGPQIVSTFLPHAIGSSPSSSAIFAETQVLQESVRIPGSDLHLIYHSSSVSGYLSSLLLQLTPSEIPPSLSTLHLKVVLEGTVFEKILEADPNVTFTFTWNKRNVYKQKVYGEATAKVSVGYGYTTCPKVVWETQTARLQGFLMDISDIGGWNLDIHHMYNFEAGLLQKGDGSTLSLRDAPRIVKTLMGTGKRRPLVCRQCSGLAKDAELLTPSALASGSDGSIYVGDFNLIRRVSPDGMVSTVLQLSATQVSYSYQLTVSPADGSVYVSDPEKYRVIRLLSVANVSEPINNLEIVAGNGERCIPGDERHCGDKGPAREARLSHPKGLAIAADKTMYIADGTNIRMVDPLGMMHTLIGHHGHKSRWVPFPCSGGIPASQVELQWPSGLALSTLDDSLHILDDHLVLQVTPNGMVRVRAGTPMHCRSSEDHPPIGTVTGLAFSPSGSLFLTEERPSKHFLVKELQPSGEIRTFAGAEPSDCGCVSGDDCSCSKDKVLLSSAILLNSVSAIAVSASGVVTLAEQKALKLFSLVHFLPEDDQNGDYQVAYPKTNELYIFNRHGQHVETRDLVTGRTTHAFLYSKNTSFGRLTKVTDSSGNKIVFLRDYKSAVSQIENTAGEKFKLEISRLRLMTRFSESPDRHHDFTYDDDSGLLLSATTPGRLTTAYEYDVSGRVRAIIMPTGSRVEMESFMGGVGRKKHLEIRVNYGGPSQGGDSFSSHFLSVKEGFNVHYNHDSVHGALETWGNGTWRQLFPWGGVARGLSSTSNPLLDAVLPIQAKLLPVTQRYVLDSASDERTANVLVTSYGVVDDSRRQERLVEKVLLVNGSRVLSRKWKGSDMSEEVTDGERQMTFKISYNANGQPEGVALANGLSAINITYDRFGRLESQKWEKTGEEYDYDQRGVLSAVTTVTSAVTRYVVGENRLLDSVTLPSGRSWGYHYDRRGGLTQITTPSGSYHSFAVQPSFGTFILFYTPPGATQAYRQHLDHTGRLVLTVFPGCSSKILFGFGNSSQAKEIVSGDGKTTLVYGQDGQMIETIHEETDLEYKADYVYKGHSLEEYRLDYGARTGLSNVKFTYERDHNFRITNVAGRIGGKNLQPFLYEYSLALGVPNRIGNFKISRPNLKETVIHDGTAIFSRKMNSRLEVVRLSVTIHKMEVFRLDLEYRRDGKISQTNTYTRNFHSKPYTNTKNYTYDADGQLVSVEAKEPWSFSYDASGNMLSLTYSTNTIPMKYDSQDRIVKFGEGGYKYDSRGAIVQNVREVNYQYNARGMLIRASRVGRFNIKYMYDHEGRLIARKDNFGNVTQFMYADQTHPEKVTHIYNPKDGNLISLVYDDRGHIIFAQMYRNKYYIATDQCGTPIMVFNQYGEVVREIMRSPFGHIIYDSNPYLYLPIDYCGGILETRTELVHMPDGKVYDPLIGLVLSPSWEEIFLNLMNPRRLTLYRYNGNDPINTEEPNWKSFDHRNLLNILGYDMRGVSPQIFWRDSDPRDLWHTFSKIPSLVSRKYLHHVADQVIGIPCISGFFQTRMESFRVASRLETLQPSALRRDFWPDRHTFELSTSPSPFGEGILVSVIGGKAIVSATVHANAIFRDVLTSVFNGSLLLDVVLTSHNTYVFYFVKENYWKASEDQTQLNRIGGEVNITVHEQGSAGTDEDKGEKVVDIKLHGSSAIIHIRYGTTASNERKRLLKHSKKVTIRRAWSDERDRLTEGLLGTVEWSPSEVEELRAHGSLSSYSARYLHLPEVYPELADDPTNVRFYRDTKRTRRNLKARKSHRCKRRWWRVFC